MSVFVYITIIGALIFAAFLGMLIWSVRDGQLDDLTTPPERVLWDDEIDS